MDIKIYLELAQLFSKFNQKLYMIGGTSRDFLLGREIDDFDLATDATPREIEKILPEADFTFSHYGTVRLKMQGKRIDIATLREESHYKDYRHPSSVTFVTEIEKDYSRRDFTVNAIYIDDQLSIHDFAQGLQDLADKKIRTIGEPNLRFQEDPLRMLRALRFKLKLGFTIEIQTSKAIKNNWELLSFLQRSKVEEEITKLRKIDTAKADRLLASMGPLPLEKKQR